MLQISWLTDKDTFHKFRQWGFLALCLLIMTTIIVGPYTKVNSPDNRADLSGAWKISLEDRMDFARPDFNDQGWDQVVLPGSFMPYALKKNNRSKGVCWLRKKIVLGEGLSKGDLGICLGRIGNADETYVNGIKVGGLGGFPPDDFPMWNHPRNYPLSEKYIRPCTENTIAVRVSYMGVGEVLGRLFITDHQSFKTYSIASTFTQIIMGYVSIAMGGALLLIFLFFYLKRAEYEEYLFYCLQLCFGLPVVLSVCSYWPIFGGAHSSFIVLALSWVALNVAHPIFLHRFYRLERRGVEIVLWCYLAVTLVVGIFFTSSSYIRLQGTVLIILTIAIGFYNFTCHVSAIIKRSPYAKVFSFFGITVVLCAIHDGFIYLEKFSGFHVNFLGYHPTVMIFHVGAIFLYTGTALILVTRFINVTDEVENLNVTLENFIMENAVLTEKLEKLLRKKPESAISTIAEEKIKNVIKYINENYLNDITREDLASSVGVHPDSLGKQFKKYTGYKLGDYIYELRVNEAARRLREEDTNIIDIAFDVGFESVRTFNRIFPKFMNETPNNYRKIYQDLRDKA